MSKKMDTLINAGHFTEAAEDGQAWLQDATPQERASNEGRRVHRRIAVARLTIADHAQSIPKLQAFQSQYADDSAVSDLVKAAHQKEASHYYRQTTLQKNSVEGYRYFRRLYPQAEDLPDARGREVQVARDALDGSSDLPALRAFLSTYATWPEAEDARKGIRSREASAAYQQETVPLHTAQAHQDFRSTYPDADEVGASRVAELEIATTEATAAQSVEAYQSFRAQYNGWPEAAAALKVAYRAEAGLALKAASEVSTPDAFDTFRARYPDPTSVRAAHIMQITQAAAGIDEHLAGHKVLPMREGLSFIYSYGSNPFLGAVFEEKKAALRSAVDQPTLWPARLYRLAYPDAPDVEVVHQQEEALAWRLAGDEGSLERYQDFFLWYPLSEHATEAEADYYRLAERSGRAQRWPRTHLESIHALSKGEVELTVSVRDCSGRRIGGLTQDVFSIQTAQGERPVTSFSGAEQDRALDIAFLLDLSGSMAEEREAISTAITKFAELFAFRNRAARFSIVGFSDEIYGKQRFSTSSRAFMRKLSNLPMNTGGRGEDAVGALVQSAKRWRGKKAERVNILFSDEDLQVNAAGLKGLGLSSHKRCQKAAAASKCMTRCIDRHGAKKKGNSKFINGMARCIKRYDKKLWTPFTRCVRRIKRQQKSYKRRYRYKNAEVRAQCLNVVDITKLNTNLAACTDYVLPGTEAMRALSEILKKSGARMFFMVPNGDDITKQALRGYAALARSIQGKIIDVPQDERSSQPYTNALMDVADQLSKQYILRYAPAPGGQISGDLTPQVLARTKYIWNEVGPPPPGQILALVERGGDARCPGFLAIIRGQGVMHRPDCHSGWSPIQSIIKDPQVVVDGPALLTVLSGRGNLYQLEKKSLEMNEATPPNTRVTNLISARGRLIAFGHLPGGQPALWVRAAGTQSWASTNLPADLPLAVKPIIYSSQQQLTRHLCLQVNTSTVDCLQDGHTEWTRHASEGLGDAPLEGYTVSSVIARDDVTLLTTDAGELFRTASAGQRWRRVSSENGPISGLVGLNGPHPVVCFASTRAVQCSETAGLDWFLVARSYAHVGHATITRVQNELYLHSRDGLQRLDVLTNRDLPSSATFFATGADTPLPALTSPLLDLANLMKADASLMLGVEGHADKRGEAEDNLDLASRRATNTAQVIKEADVQASRIRTRSFGESRPIRAGDSRAALARNRRVELILSRRRPTKGWGANECD